MFAKGNRFPLKKPSEVPGPNTYNIQEPEYDAYKRAGFVEKQDRFSNAKPSEVPGPGAYSTDMNAADGRPVGSQVASGDRFAALQRKLVDLERVHNESKKSYQADVGRLKQDLSHAQRMNTEQAEQLSKLKKQNDAYNLRVQELKKTSLIEQAEIKELRAKLRVSEHEGAQLAAKQDDTGEAKKTLQLLEMRRKDELLQKDRRLTELEKSLAAEKKKTENLAVELKEARTKASTEIQEERVARSAIEVELCQAKIDSEQTRSALQGLRGQHADSEEALLDQLDQHKRMLSRVAEEYARLASSTVSTTAHKEVKHEAMSLRLRVNRLERKFANAEGQVIELAQLIRQGNEENVFLLSRLQDVEQDLSFRSELAAMIDGSELDAHLEHYLTNLSREVQMDFLESQVHVQQALRFDAELWATFEALRSDQLLLHSSFLVRHVDRARRDVETQSSQLIASEKQQAELLRQVSVAHAEHERVKQELADTSRSLSETRASQESLKQQSEAEKQRAKSEAVKLEQTLKREKEARDRALSDVQKSKAAEEGLLREIDQLCADLAEAERYQQAYTSLVDQVDALVRKNALAEGEAQQLSKFNAEILGHHNPAQRIQYVDRIRGELHETKQELLMIIKERDAIAGENESLVHELQAYKSVKVATDSKARTTMTRVGRQPLVSQSLNVRPSSSTTHAQGASKSMAGDRKGLEPMPEVEYKDGDMTIDELM